MVKLDRSKSGPGADQHGKHEPLLPDPSRDIHCHEYLKAKNADRQ